MLQYSCIAQVSEEALRQTELASQNFKAESEKAMQSLQANLQSLQERINELEGECKLKAEEAISSDAGKDQALMEALSEIASLKDNCSTKMSEISVMESQISALKEDLQREHQRWRAAQDNYERQDPYFRMTRDVAPQLGYLKPALIECMPVEYVAPLTLSSNMEIVLLEKIGV